MNKILNAPLHSSALDLFYLNDEAEEEEEDDDEDDEDDEDED